MSFLKHLKNQAGGMSGRTIFLGTVVLLVFVLVAGMILACAAIASLGAERCAPDAEAASVDSGYNDDGGNLNGPNGLGPGGDKPPDKFIPIYQAAAAQAKLGPQGPSMLAAIHFRETGFADTGGNKNGGEYEGPMAWSHTYFPAFAVAHDGKSKQDQDLFNVADAIYASANHLHREGAPKNWHDAIFAYNHAEWYVSDILELADKYKIPANGGDAGDFDAEDTSGCDPPNGGGDYSGECTANGIAYVSQPGASGLTKQFGAPGDAGAGKRQKSVSLLGGTVQVHEKIAACVEAVERERKAKGINYPITSGIGGYRSSDGQLGNDSFHVYGAAIDVNPETNPYCNGGSVVGNPAYCDNPEIPMELVKIFRKYGFYWGGDYTSLKDYMHFEWHGEKP